MRFSFKHHFPFRLHLLVVLALFVVSTFVAISQVSAATPDQARDGRLVTFHDRDEEKVILTHAQNVRDALAEAHISVVDEDMVEPGLNEPLVATDYTVNIYRARPVIVVDGMARQKIMTAAQTASAISSAAGMQLHDEDTTKMTASTDVVNDGAGVTLTIDRATAFSFNLYGTTTTAYSRAETVGGMLSDKHIQLASNDTLSVDSKTPLTAGMTVSIWRNGAQTATIEEAIAFPVRQVQDVDQPAGYRKIETPGTNGKKSVTYQITMQNGKEVSRAAIQSVVIDQPKEQVEIVGAKPAFGGDFAAALAKLRACEAGGNYANKNNPSYRGAYQYSYSTWANYGGYYDPADAPAAVQDQAARNTYLKRGWQPWPNCGKGLPDTYR
ncbi:MAG: exported protein of unknown function [Candidatus Saccharibacteria bacterium]|nr:exported protein of unknown function [Candidatus Saccharibacteria bacterium]